MKENDYGLVSISRQDWSLNRRGERDQERHNEKVKEAIRGNLGDLVSDGSIITADPMSKKTIKIPMRSLELPHIKYGDNKGGGGGIGTGDGSGAKPGDTIPGDGKDGEAGTGAGTEYYETEMTIEEIQALVFDDLGLPNIQPRSKDSMESDNVVFNDIRKNRSGAGLDMARTVMQNLLRNARESGVAKIGGIIPEDFRVRRWESEPKPINSAVVIAMMDISGSMGEFEKYVTRAVCWWAVSFLRTKYPAVDIVFVAHDTEAYEVTEEQFFTRGTGGGTKCSAANQMAYDITRHRYPTKDYNVYPLHFSDGDNYVMDNNTCVKLVKDLLEDDISQYAYVQIGARSQSGLLAQYQREIKDPRFNGIMIKDKAGVLPALKKIFKPDDGAAR